MIPKVSKSTRLKRQQSDQIQNQLRDLAIREVRDALNSTMRDLAHQLNGSAQGIGGNSSGSLGGFNLFGGSSNDGTAGNFNGLMNGVLRIFTSRKQISVSQSAATESTRSLNDNQFYLESRSQREASLGRLSSESTRNL
jgi:hypothetical protein